MTGLAAAALLLPDNISVPTTNIGDRWTGVTKMPGTTPADMAVEVGCAAMAASRVRPQDIEWTLHSGSGYQGPMGWPVHHHIQREVVGSAGNALEIKQYCAAGLTAWIVAAALLSKGEGAALCTGADNWSWGDRFATARRLGGEPFSDVAHAAVLTCDEGFAHILGYATVSCPNGTDVWRTRENFWEAAALSDYADSYRRALRESDAASRRETLETVARAIMGALAKAHVSPQYVTHFVPHGSGTGEPYRVIARKLGLPWSEDLYRQQLAQGYLAVSTQVAGLIWHADQGLPADSIVLLVATEYDLSASAVVLRVNRAPVTFSDGAIRVLA